MTKKEFSTFCMALKTFFPRDNVLPNEYAMELWFNELCDLDYQVAQTALKKYVHTNKFAPTIAEIRSMATEVQYDRIPDWGDGWSQVISAINTYGYYQEGKALDSMDNITRQAVKRMGFKNICLSENIVADRANFRMVYEQIRERKQQEQQMSPALKDVISRLRLSNDKSVKQLREKENSADAV